MCAILVISKATTCLSYRKLLKKDYSKVKQYFFLSFRSSKQLSPYHQWGSGLYSLLISGLVNLSPLKRLLKLIAKASCS